MPRKGEEMAASTFPSDVFPFLNLPIEIRHMIYQILLTNTTPIRFQLNTDAAVPAKILDDTVSISY
jgi:hypothetical protein